MAFYGNILTIYDGDAAQSALVESVLQNRDIRFERLEFSFFIETTSIVNTQDVVKDLKALAIKFIFFHNHNSDGSMATGKDIDPQQLDNVKSILLE